jgi:hypothetical protein
LGALFFSFYPYRNSDLNRGSRQMHCATSSVIFRPFGWISTPIPYAFDINNLCIIVQSFPFPPSFSFLILPYLAVSLIARFLVVATEAQLLEYPRPTNQFLKRYETFLKRPLDRDFHSFLPL